MNYVSGFVKDTVGGYITELPLPDSLRGWFSLSLKDWARLLPFLTVVGGSGYLMYRKAKGVDSRCNVNGIQKDQKKVVNSVDVEDLGDKTAFCRCWRSERFPFCDGSHNAHDELTGDNVGPLIIKKSA